MSRPKCRVCKGTHRVEGAFGFVDDCIWCDAGGFALHVCKDCGAALPCCPCFELGGFRRKLTGTGP